MTRRPARATPQAPTARSYTGALSRAASRHKSATMFEERSKELRSYTEAIRHAVLSARPSSAKPRDLSLARLAERGLVEFRFNDHRQFAAIDAGGVCEIGCFHPVTGATR